MSKKDGLLVVISGPAGSGKGTVIKELMAKDKRFSYSISATTRGERKGELHGREYYFITHEEFRQRIADGRMLEYTEYCGNYYGTPYDETKKALDEGKKYIDLGVERVILGTAAVTDDAFLQKMVSKYKDAIAVGVDLKDGYVAIKGWTEKSQLTADEFFRHLSEIGVRTVICTDISKDGAMQGTNRELYKELSKKYTMDIVASGGVSSLDDIKALKEMNLYGAILGKAYYIGAVDLKEAVEVAK